MCGWPVSATLKPSHPNGPSKLPRLSHHQSSDLWAELHKQQTVFISAGHERSSRPVCPSSWEALWFTIKIKLTSYANIRGNIYQHWTVRVPSKAGKPLIHCAGPYHSHVLENQRKMWFKTCGSVCSGKEELESTANGSSSLLMISECDRWTLTWRNVFNPRGLFLPAKTLRFLQVQQNIHIFHVHNRQQLRVSVQTSLFSDRSLWFLFTCEHKIEREIDRGGLILHQQMLKSQ